MAAAVHAVSASGGIVFFGASDTGLRCCRALIEGGVTIAGIVTRPRHFRISWSPGGMTNARFADFHDLAAEHRLPLLDVADDATNEDLRRAVAAWHPALLMVVGWYHLVTAGIRALAPRGAVGVHASMLPRYRGGAPLVWAIINGERETGVTLFHLVDRVDAGDIVDQRRIAIGADETIADVVPRSTDAAVSLIVEHAPALLDGTAPRRAQAEFDATVMPQRRPEDGVIDWARMTARGVHDWVRAQTRPYPGAFALADGRQLFAWRTRVSSTAAESAAPGTIVDMTDRLLVTCADGGVVDIVEAGVERDGAIMSGTEAAARCGLRAGDRFGTT
ncbi:MAG TPA: methionyl-tRNA formyltransferase [Vicinamibacterales bacterium]|nr:methionyl-tRNA formyltransferase [Vicinamibacterales bacterium]